MMIALLMAMNDHITVIEKPRYVTRYATANFQQGRTPIETVITVSGTRPLFQREFVIGYLTKVGRNGAYVNELYRAWNQMRDAIKKSRSTYASFRKLILNMKKEGMIVSIPEAETRARGLIGEAPIARSYYRLNPDYVDGR
jgi:hypothetical protein